MDFLNVFVENARKNGAKEYRKITTSALNDTELRFTPYEQKKIQSAFPFQVQPEK